MRDSSLQSDITTWESVEKTWDQQISDQFSRLPRWAYRIDRVVIKITEIVLVLIGVIFTLLISFDVVSRYAFSYSSFFTSAAAKFLLLWFFLLGAGLALRQGGHVGFVMLVSRLPRRFGRAMQITAQLLMLLFFLQMVWSGAAVLGLATRQIDPSLNISLVWSFLAIPVGFALLIYHLLMLMVLDRMAEKAGSGAPTCY